MDGPLTNMNYDDYSKQAVMRPVIAENKTFSGNTDTLYMNRVYGQVRNIYVCVNNGWQRGSDGKIINGNNYVFLNTAEEVWALSSPTASTRAVLFLDTESVS